MMNPSEDLTEELEQVKRELAQSLEIGQSDVVSRISRGSVRLHAGRYVTRAQLDREFDDIMAEPWDLVEQ